MTRSLGDFYAHHHGVTHEPELRTLTAPELRERRLDGPRLILASDGVWDLWTFEETQVRALPCTPDPRPPNPRHSIT
jgi:serine/threonine protein phosphatase PrpC